MGLVDELRRRWWLAPVAVVIVLLLFGARVAGFYTDILWFSSVGYLEVFTTSLLTRVGLGLMSALFVAALVGGNLLLAHRLVPRYRIPSPQEEAVERYRDAIDPYARPLLLMVALVIGVLSGLTVAAEWSTFLLWLNGTSFGQNDPQFGLDLGYFVFRLPFYTFLNSWLFTTLAFTTVLTALAHYVFGGIRPQSPGQKISPQATVHLSILLAALVAIRGWGFWLDRYLLSYSERGVTTGLSYTDATAQLRAYELLTVISVVCVVLFLANLRFRNFLLPSAGVGILLVAAIVLSGIYPAAIQRFRVEPQELQRERPYIERNMELTRFGFGLELGGSVEFEPFPAEGELDAETVAANADTLEAIRLWDPQVLRSVYSQLQGLRRYFEFPDVDVDRYMIDGQQRQVNIAVRELNDASLPADTWQNRHLVYTHGLGFVSTDVSAKGQQGEPVFLIDNIPPQGLEELEVSQPRVYFGQSGPEYSIIQADVAELDFVSAEEDAETRYDGEDGVGVGGPLRRLAFALRYAEPNFILSSLIESDSRILFNREIEERVQAVAPFLQLDGDPYAVAVDGGIKWVLDAYTTSAMLPYSERHDLAELTATARTIPQEIANPDGTIDTRDVSARVPNLVGTANYIRNSVKAVVDAYDGTVTLYVVDPEDPIIQTWQRIFPDIFTDGDDAGEELWAHFRYPEDMLRVQANVFQRYHIEDTTTFYTGEDAWGIPVDAAAVENQADPPQEGQEPPLRPYYLNIRLPGEEEQEFALIQPFNPAIRPNLIAWMAARSDPEVYGQLRVYQMPAARNVQGTEQVQATINQDREIASAITLLNQSGSRVIYGNLLIIPIGDALLYAQPLFARAEQGEIPELRMVNMVFGDRVVSQDTLAEALAELFGDAAPAGVPPGAEPDEVAGAGEEDEAGEDDDPAETPGEGFDPQVAALIQQALDAFEQADQALADGDLGGYQEATRQAQTLLEEARALTTGAAPDTEASPDQEEPEPDEAEPEAAAAANR
ncbi:MAG: UPF0182 family protein [Nitriliruptorales bacterium]|nr:UPF0182 family protein [Nitriliruptorales bacterium]